MEDQSQNSNLNDCFREEEAQEKLLTSKPTCFVVFGKPGCGKTTLAKRLANAWNCQYINGQESLSQALDMETDLGKRANELLLNGGSVPESMMFTILSEKLSSPEVIHHGYVLDDFPTLSEDYFSIPDQLEFMRKLTYEPDFIVNIKIPDRDLLTRRSGFRVDPLTNVIYTRDFYESSNKSDSRSRSGPDEGEEEVEEEDDEDEGGEDIEDILADGLDEEESDGPTADIIDRLCRRPEDSLDSVTHDIKAYKGLILRQLEDYIGDHDAQKVIELDGNMPAKTLSKSLLFKLSSILLHRGLVPMRLQGGEDQDDIPDDMDTEDMLRSLAASSMMAPGFRWRRSRWGRLCPVSLFEGNIVQGTPQFAVSFLDKMYLMATTETREKFVRSPRKYLAAPQPRPPCKLCIVGPPLSGKTTLSNALAQHYGAKVFDMKQLMKSYFEEAKRKLIEEVRQEALESAVHRTASLQQQVAVEKDVEKDEAEDTDESSAVEGAETDAEVEAAPDQEEGIEETKETNLSTNDTFAVVDENHPDVKRLVEEAVASAEAREITLATDKYIDVLETALHDWYKEMQERDPTGRLAGNWILDSFPETRDQFSAMTERGIVPDDLICLKDTTEDSNALVVRWYQREREQLPEDSRLEEKETEPSPLSPTESSLAGPKADDFRKMILEFDRNWTSVQSVARNVSGIEPVLVDCTKDSESLYKEAVRKLTDMYLYKGWEYTGMDQDEEEEDMIDDDEFDEEMEDDDAFQRNHKKPFGDARHFCPIQLTEKGVLWPGNPDVAAKYKEKVYFFSTPDARTQFLEDPEPYLAKDKPLQPPPLRVLLLGPKGSGKTLHGRALAKRCGVFHISFKDLLQEKILAKTKKRIGPDYPEDDMELDNHLPEDEKSTSQVVDSANTQGVSADETQTSGTGNLSEQDKVGADPEVVESTPNEEVELTEVEENIRDNITDNDPLTRTTLDSVLSPLWQEEPYKSVGFILEAYPRTAEEVRYLAENGFFPDCAAFLAVEDTNVVERLMPPLLTKWKKKRDILLAKKQKERETKLAKKEEERKRRIEEKIAQIAERKAEKLREKELLAQEQGYEEDEDEEEEEDEEEGEEDIGAIVDAEMAEEEEDDADAEEEEETEEDAIERIRGELTDRFDDEMSALGFVRDALEEVSIPRIDIEGGRKPHVVQYIIEKALKPAVEFRESLLDSCQPVSSTLAKKLLIQGYKQATRFGRWCPVQLSNQDILPHLETPERPVFPVVYRQYIYFLSSEEARENFVMCPAKYIRQATPLPTVPLRLAIIGPPKSGKSTLAHRFVKDYGVVRLSVGEAIRRVLLSQENTELASHLQQHLKAGLTVPDELAVQALEVAILDVQCQTRGFVLDGYPMTEHQLRLLTARSIIPYITFELRLNDSEVMERGAKDRRSPDRVLPLHDSHSILTIKLGSFQREVPFVRQWYQDEHRNLYVISGERSKWWVWSEALQRTKQVIHKIRIYVDRRTKGLASSIADMCITPYELHSRLGVYGQYCPVSLNDRNELVDCSEFQNLEYAAEYRGHYYCMASKSELISFLESPEKYVPPLAPRTLPTPDLLPKKCSPDALRGPFPAQLELLGYCPVTYTQGDFSYEALVLGKPSFLAEYRGKIYALSSSEKRERFMRLPEKYSNVILPRKLPPQTDAIPISSLPMMGYLEQSAAIAIIKALTAAGCFKPKYPFLTAKQSGILYVAYHLKAYNPRSSEYVRKKYKKKLKQFEEKCQLIAYLGNSMSTKYCEPEDRPIDFDHKLLNFLALKETPPPAKWLA